MLKLTLIVLMAVPLPTAVRATIAERWPQATVAKVEAEANGELEVAFTSLQGAFEVTFAADGGVISEERKIALKATPATVQKTIAGWKQLRVQGIEQVTEAGVTYYEISASPASGPRLEIVLDANGTELKRAPATE